MIDGDNQLCFDCGKSRTGSHKQFGNLGSQNPGWASVSNGVFLCTNCASVHRGLSVAFSSVKSLTIDGWNERQLKAMSLGGNKRLKVFFQEFDLQDELP